MYQNNAKRRQFLQFEKAVEQAFWEARYIFLFVFLIILFYSFI